MLLCKNIILICGHYEGVDERVAEHLVTDEISIGDYLLSGGESAAMVMIDSLVRLLPGAIGSGSSLDEESHVGNLVGVSSVSPGRPNTGVGMCLKCFCQGIIKR